MVTNWSPSNNELSIMVKSNTALLCPAGMTTDAGTVTLLVMLDVRFTTTTSIVGVGLTLTCPCPASAPSPSVAAVVDMLRESRPEYGKTGFVVPHHALQRAKLMLL